jgi:thiamine kinase-like enzyme
MDKTKLKQQFNQLLQRCNKAEKFIDDPKRTEEELNKWMPEFLKIIAQLSALLEKIGEHTPEDVEHGFKIEGE